MTSEPQLLRSVNEADIECRQSENRETIKAQNCTDDKQISVSSVNITESRDCIKSIHVAPLRFMYVCINDTLVKTLVDSGAQVPIIRRIGRGAVGLEASVDPTLFLTWGQPMTIDSTLFGDVKCAVEH